MDTLPLRSWADIDLDALRHNLGLLRRRVPAGTGVVGVVKADAYGHGAVAVARCLREEGIRVLAVACLDEARELRAAGLSEPVWHLGVPLPDEAEALIAERVTPTAAHEGLIEALEAALPADAPPFEVHLKLDTGMGRRGAHLDEVRRLWKRIETGGRLRVAALCTHLATADGDLAFAEEQLGTFVRWRDALAAEGLIAPRSHACNGPAVLRLDAAFDDIRPGLALYGIAAYAAPAVPELRPVMSVRSRLCQVRDLPAGHDVGYAHGCRLERPTRVGLLPLGYGDGWPWRLSGVGEALVHGVRVPYLGRVNMDLIQIDLNNVPQARVGDVVTLLGRDGDECIGAVELARAADVSEYTLPTQLGRRVVRRYLRDGRVVAQRRLDGVLESLEPAAAGQET